MVTAPQFLVSPSFCFATGMAVYILSVFFFAFVAGSPELYTYDYTLPVVCSGTLLRLSRLEATDRTDCCWGGDAFDVIKATSTAKIDHSRTLYNGLKTSNKKMATKARNYRSKSHGNTFRVPQASGIKHKKKNRQTQHEGDPGWLSLPRLIFRDQVGSTCSRTRWPSRELLLLRRERRVKLTHCHDMYLIHDVEAWELDNLYFYPSAGGFKTKTIQKYKNKKQPDNSQ